MWCTWLWTAAVRKSLADGSWAPRSCFREASPERGTMDCALSLPESLQSGVSGRTRRSVRGRNETASGRHGAGGARRAGGTALRTPFLARGPGLRMEVLRAAHYAGSRTLACEVRKPCAEMPALSAHGQSPCGHPALPGGAHPGVVWRRRRNAYKLLHEHPGVLRNPIRRPARLLVTGGQVRCFSGGSDVLGDRGQGPQSHFRPWSQALWLPSRHGPGAPLRSLESRERRRGRSAGVLFPARRRGSAREKRLSRKDAHERLLHFLHLALSERARPIEDKRAIRGEQAIRAYDTPDSQGA